AVGRWLGVEAARDNTPTAGETERALAASAQPPNGGLIVPGGPASRLQRDLIVALAARHKLPAVYFERSFVAAGGLISYGTDYVEQYRQAPGRGDRIPHGQK